MNRRKSARIPLSLLTLSTLVGCDSCSEDKPYVPYTIDPSAAGSLGSSAPSPIGLNGPPPAENFEQRFEPVLAKRLTNDPKELKTSVGSVRAPERSVFELLLEADVTADKKTDVLAWMRTSDGTAGELVHFAAAREGGPLHPRTLVPLPADLTLRAECKGSTDLRQVGPRTVALTFVRTCSEERGTTITEWKAAVVPIRDPAVRLTVLIDQPSGDQQLKIDLDALDRDGDQFDDLLAYVQMSDAPSVLDEPDGGRVSVNLHYFERPAGLSRDPHEPAASFGSLARSFGQKAKSSKRDAVSPAARNARRIHQMLCAESGRPRVQIGGAPLQCGATDALNHVARAELDASIGAGDLISSLGAYDRMQSQGANATDTDAARKRIEEAMPRTDVDSYQLPFGPNAAGQDVTWSSLAFDTDGALMIRTHASVMRFDPRTRVAVPDPASGPVTPWRTRVEAPSGNASLESVVDPCNGGLLRARMSRGGTSLEVPLPVDPLTTRGCVGSARPVTARPILWSNEGLMIILSGTPLWVSTDGSKVRRLVPGDGKGPMGGPKSPDGRTLAHGSSLGVLVMDADKKGKLWRASSMAGGYERLTGCTAANDAAAVACIDGTRTRVFLP